jgi:peptidyl-prolyl cis-trans isomerase C
MENCPMNPFENLKQMQDQRVAGASHILLAPGKCTLPLEEAKALMESWKAEIGRDAEKFAAKAGAESHCPTAARGGDLGFLVRSSCSQAFNEILFEKEPGQIYGPITTPAGLHLIYLASCREPKPNDNHAKGTMPWDNK